MLLDFKQSTLVLLMISLSLLLSIYKVWTALDPLQYKRVTVGRSEDGTLQSVGNCSSSGTASTVTSSLLFALNLVLVIFAGKSAVSIVLSMILCMNLVLDLRYLIWYLCKSYLCTNRGYQ